MDRPRYGSPLRATVNGILDLFGRQERIGTLEQEERIDGRRCLITGANRGLGRAVAVELARRGGRLTLACRGGHPQAGEEIGRESGGGQVEMAFIDLSDFDTILRFRDQMLRRDRRFDLTVLNAGVVPRRARRTRQGFEEMFAVNYLANFLLVNALLDCGVIPRNRRAGEVTPRIVFVSSETHRSAPPLDPTELGRFHDYGMRQSVAEYAVSKLLVSTYASELARRLSPGGRVEAAVHQLCPGPINSGIASEAPGWARPLLKAAFTLFFKSPRRAAEPVVYLCCARSLEGRTGVYLHLMKPKSPSEQALDPEAGRALWEASARLIASGPPS